MKVAISYFAQLRNFKPNMIPVSTAAFDPRWYHDYKGPKQVFYDKKGVINGARCELLVPNEEVRTKCSGPKNCENVDPDSCPFLMKYSEQLDNVDFNVMLNYLERMEEWAIVNTKIPKDDLILVFLVYEKYDNPCSERNAIIKYFRKHGIDIEELHYPIS